MIENIKIKRFITASKEVEYVDTWNATFPTWPVKRLSTIAPLAEGA